MALPSLVPEGRGLAQRTTARRVVQITAGHGSWTLPRARGWAVPARCGQAASGSPSDDRPATIAGHDRAVDAGRVVGEQEGDAGRCSPRRPPTGLSAGAGASGCAVNARGAIR